MTKIRLATTPPNRPAIACGVGIAQLAALISLGSVPASAQAPAAVSATPLIVVLTASDPDIRYIGRFDMSDQAGPRCAWSASEVDLAVSGGGLNAVISDSTGNDALEVVVDGKAATVLNLQKGPALYNLVKETALPGANTDHSVMLVKRTEAFVGTVQFQGFQLLAGSKLMPLSKRSSRRLEVIGDSISCGYGNEGKDQNEHFTPQTENAYLSYGAVAARDLGAEYTCIAWSGRKMWPNNTIPEIYDRTLPDDPTSMWDFSKWTPDVVVINLATNDFGAGNPDRDGWTAAYEQFIAHVRKNYPKAVIYCASGPMMSDNWPPGQKALTTANDYLNQIVDDEHKAGDPNVHFLAFGTQDIATNGVGADWHPSLKTDAKMAAALEKAVDGDLGWK